MCYTTKTTNTISNLKSVTTKSRRYLGEAAIARGCGRWTGSLGSSGAGEREREGVRVEELGKAIAGRQIRHGLLATVEDWKANRN